MNYQEAIDTLQDIHDVAETRIKSGDARGVVYINPNRLADLKNAISAMQDLQQYEKIGTLEEVREAVEKQQADKPRILRLSIYGAPYGYLYRCPNCEYRIIIKDHRGSYSGPRTKYCPDCGKRLNWGEEE